jgi:uncharacterized protein YqjF (DUF2071 family)
MTDGSNAQPQWRTMATRKDGLSVDHIPFPMPEGRWILRQNWKKLTFLHWEVEPDALKQHLPSGLELDLHEGKAYVGCIPFVMEKVRPSGLPAVPGVSTFGEFNIRTYVTKNGVPGVFFLTLDAQSHVTCFYANRRYGLAYRYAKASVEGTLEDGYEWTSTRSNGGVGLSGSATTTSAARQATPGTLEFFLFERYSLYTVHNGRLRHGYTHHEKWWYCDAEVEVKHNSLVDSYGLGIKDATKPELVHMSAGVEVVTWHLLYLGAESSE